MVKDPSIQKLRDPQLEAFLGDFGVAGGAGGSKTCGRQSPADQGNYHMPKVYIEVLGFLGLGIQYVIVCMYLDANIYVYMDIVCTEAYIIYLYTYI